MKMYEERHLFLGFHVIVLRIDYHYSTKFKHILEL